MRGGEMPDALKDAISQFFIPMGKMVLGNIMNTNPF